MESRQRALRSPCVVGVVSFLLVACVCVPKSSLTLFGLNPGLISLQDGKDMVPKLSER